MENMEKQENRKILETWRDIDKEHLRWIYNRLINVYNENENYDYMIKFRNIINKYPSINEIKKNQF